MSPQFCSKAWIASIKEGAKISAPTMTDSQRETWLKNLREGLKNELKK